MSEFWNDFQFVFGGNIPIVIITILKSAGYNSAISLEGMNEDEINVIEKFVQQNKHLVNSSEYCDTNPFVFLPGHKKILVLLGEKAKNFKPTKRKNDEFSLSEARLILKELIKSEMNNAHVPPTRNRYSDIIQWFSTYIYILSGKAAYEILCNNLAIPKVPSICKLIA